VADWYIHVVRPFFPSVRWTTGGDDVWLTFDDGPHLQATPDLLDLLRSEEVTALFFLLGRQADRYPEIVGRIRAEGHLIGNHGYDHRPLWFRPRRHVVEELRRTSEAIERAGGGHPTVFRPPYGRLDPSTPVHARRAGLATMLFSVNSWDFSGGRPEEIVSRVVRRARPGDILLLHDNDRTAPFARAVAGGIIDRCRRAGLNFGKPIV
jgi:peptidoglycan/xylan/chitin deacetylase (PgdA/CDA1 family)